MDMLPEITMQSEAPAARRSSAREAHRPDHSGHRPHQRSGFPPHGGERADRRLCRAHPLCQSDDAGKPAQDAAGADGGRGADPARRDARCGLLFLHLGLGRHRRRRDRGGDPGGQARRAGGDAADGGRARAAGARRAPDQRPHALYGRDQRGRWPPISTRPASRSTASPASASTTTARWRGSRRHRWSSWRARPCRTQAEALFVSCTALRAALAVADMEQAHRPAGRHQQPGNRLELPAAVRRRLVATRIRPAA